MSLPARHFFFAAADFRPHSIDRVPDRPRDGTDDDEPGTGLLLLGAVLVVVLVAGVAVGAHAWGHRPSAS